MVLTLGKRKYLFVPHIDSEANVILLCQHEFKLKALCLTYIVISNLYRNS